MAERRYLIIYVPAGTFVEPDVDSRFVRNVDKMKQVIKEKLEVNINSLELLHTFVGGGSTFSSPTVECIHYFLFPFQTFYAEEKTIKVLMEANEADIWGVEKKLRQLEQLPDNGREINSRTLTT